MTGLLGNTFLILMETTCIAGLCGIGGEKKQNPAHANCKHAKGRWKKAGSPEFSTSTIQYVIAVLVR
jgi:hypothetical protein